MTYVQTNWFVITGAPSSGKTSVLNELRSYGYMVHPDQARETLENHPNLIKTSKSFQEIVSAKSIQLHKETPKDELHFFDYGLPDNIVFQKMAKLIIKGSREAAERYRYRKVFLLQNLDFAKDGVRDTHHDLQEEISRNILSEYQLLDYKVILISANLSIQERAKIISREVTQCQP